MGISHGGIPCLKRIPVRPVWVKKPFFYKQCGGTGWDDEGNRTCFLCLGEKKTLCPDCLGKGEYWTGNDVCLICKGKGGRGCVCCRSTGVMMATDGQIVPCDECNGTGISICDYCAGKGYYDQDDREKCMRCGGTGKGLCLACAHIHDENYVCPVCGGTRLPRADLVMHRKRILPGKCDRRYLWNK
jgi:hypothetical protein